MTRPTFCSLSLSAASALAVGATLLISPELARGGEPVTVQARDGRVLTGEVDARTDADLLWLRSTAPSIVMRSAIRWTSVVKARHGDREFEPAEFRPLAEELKSELPSDFFSSETPEQEAAREAETVQEPPKPTQKVRSICIDAVAANWDADVELDGLEVRILALAGDGSLVPAAGMLRARLIGRNYQRHGEPFQEIGRWSKRVRSTDYDEFRGALYRLDFRTVHPEFDLKFGSYGMLHVQLGVPGHGTFEASVQVRVRSYSELRDQLELRDQKRFFPGERTTWRSR